MEFGDLPTDLFQLMITFFDADTKLVARVINKKWFNLIDERDFVTFLVAADQVEEVVKTFSRCAKPIYLSFLKNKFRSISDVSNHITNLSNLTGLEIEHIRDTAPIQDWMALAVLTDLQYLKILQNTDSVPIDLYGYLKGLTLLEELKPTKAADLDVLKNLSKIQSLDLTFQEEEYNPFTLLPNPSILTKLIAIGEKFKFTPEDLNPYVNGLKDLIYDEMHSEQLFSVGKLTNLESLGITAHDIDEYPAHLTSLSVTDVPPRHMSKLTNLGFLRINFNESWPEAERKELFSYIKSNGLQELIINSLTIIDEETGSNYFNELARFTKLEYLRLHIEGKFDATQLAAAINSLTNLVDLEVKFFQAGNNVSVNISTALARLTEIAALRGNVTFEDASKMTSLKSISAKPGPVAFSDLVLLTNLEQLSQIPDTPNMVNALTNFQHLTLLSLLDASPQMCNAIGQLTNLENLTLHINANANMETWTNLNKLTWLDLDVRDSKPLENLTLLTSLQYLAVTMDSEKEFRLDQQKIFEKLPKLYEIEAIYY